MVLLRGGRWLLGLMLRARCVDRLVEIVLPWRVGSLGRLRSHARAGVSSMPDLVSLRFDVLGWRKGPSDGGTPPSSAASGSETILAGCVTLVVHEEGPAVRDEGGIRVAFLLVFLVFPPPALRQRLCPRGGRANCWCGVSSCRTSVEINHVGLFSIGGNLEAVHHHFRVLEGGEGGIGAGNGGRGLPLGSMLPGLCIPRAALLALCLALGERGSTVDLAKVAVVCIGVLVHVAEHRCIVALGVVGQRCHRLALILVVGPPATRNVGRPLAGGSHDCGVWGESGGGLGRGRDRVGVGVVLGSARERRGR